MLFVIVNNDLTKRTLKGSKLFMLEDEREKIIAEELKVVDEGYSIRLTKIESVIKNYRENTFFQYSNDHDLIFC